MLAKEFRYILAVAECGSITKAAEMLYISQPALSRYISDLEQHLDIKLFERTGKKLVLTEFGNYFIEAGRKIVDIVDELEAQINASDSTIHGSLKIGCARRGAYIIPSVLSKFFKLFPKINIELYESEYLDTKNSLVSGKIDLAILKEPLMYNRSDLEFIPLFSEELVLAVPAEHPMAAYADHSRKDCAYPWIDLSLFANEHFILYKSGHPNRDLSEKILQKYNISPSHFYDTNNIEGALYLVQNGQGVCFSPELYAERSVQLDIGAPKIKIFSIGEPVQKYQYCLAYRKNSFLTKYTKAFIALLQQEYSEQLL